MNNKSSRTLKQDLKHAEDEANEYERKHKNLNLGMSIKIKTLIDSFEHVVRNVIDDKGKKKNVEKKLKAVKDLSTEVKNQISTANIKLNIQLAKMNHVHKSLKEQSLKTPNNKELKASLLKVEEVIKHIEKIIKESKTGEERIKKIEAGLAKA